MPDTTPARLAHDVLDGPGTPIVLLHAGVADRRMWDPQWAELAGRRAAVRLDLRGFGESAEAPTGDWSHHDDVLAVLDDLGIGRAHLVGASFGAGVAVETALARPALAASVLVCPPGGSLLATLTDDLAAFFAEERAALDADDLDAAVEANVRAWVIGPGRREEDVDSEAVAAVRDMQRRAFEIAASWADLAGEHPAHPAPEATELDPPALERLGELPERLGVLVGAHDLDTTRDAADRILAARPDAVRFDRPDAAHLPTLERPHEFTRLLLDWTAAD